MGPHQWVSRHHNYPGSERQSQWWNTLVVPWPGLRSLRSTARLAWGATWTTGTPSLQSKETSARTESRFGNCRRGTPGGGDHRTCGPSRHRHARRLQLCNPGPSRYARGDHQVPGQWRHPDSCPAIPNTHNHHSWCQLSDGWIWPGACQGIPESLWSKQLWKPFQTMTI